MRPGRILFSPLAVQSEILSYVGVRTEFRTIRRRSFPMIGVRSVLIVLFLFGPSEFEVSAQDLNSNLSLGLPPLVQPYAGSNQFYDSTGNYLGQSQSSGGTTRYFDDVGNYLGQSVDQSQYGAHSLRRSKPELVR